MNFILLVPLASYPAAAMIEPRRVTREDANPVLDRRSSASAPRWPESLLARTVSFGARLEFALGAER